MSQFYCTVGRGMEDFCRSELGQLQAVVHCAVEGKIFFSVPENQQYPFTLKTAERLFIAAYHAKPDFDVSSKVVGTFHLQRLLSEIPWRQCLQKWQKLHPDAPQDALPFRVNARVTGTWRQILQPIRIARSFAQRLSKSSMLLKPCLKQALIVIDLHISDQHITAGIALSLNSHANKGPHHGLRSTTASAMAICLHRYCDDLNENQSIILDPMCGKGSVLYELQNYITIGVDNNKQQICYAKENIPRASLVLGDARYLPFKSGTVDHIVCDVPFGIKYCNQNELKDLIPSMIIEMLRVVKKKSVIVLLLSHKQLTTIQDLVQKHWRLANIFELTLGLTEAVICVFFCIANNSYIS